MVMDIRYRAVAAKLSFFIIYNFFCITYIWNFNFLLALSYRWKYEKLNFAIENTNFAAGSISNIHYHVKN